MNRFFEFLWIRLTKRGDKTRTCMGCRWHVHETTERLNELGFANEIWIGSRNEVNHWCTHPRNLLCDPSVDVIGNVHPGWARKCVNGRDWFVRCGPRAYLYQLAIDHTTEQRATQQTIYHHVNEYKNNFLSGYTIGMALIKRETSLGIRLLNNNVNRIRDKIKKKRAS